MGTTPIKGMRYPDLSQLGMGPDDFNKMAYDLDGVYTTEDANRKAALYRNRASIRNASTAGSLAKTVWGTTVYDTLVYDTLGTQVNLGANNDRITCKAQGAYLVVYGAGITVSGALGSSGVVFAGISKGISTTRPDPNFSVHQISLLNSSDSLVACAWTVFQLNVNDFVTSRLFWNGTPAGPFTTTGAMMTMIQLNST